jgi:hypothetical protein
VKQVRDKVAKGELTRDQARELIHKHFAEQGGAGAPPPGGPAVPPAGGAAGAGHGAPAATHGPGGRGAHGGPSAFAGRETGRFENVLSAGSRDATPFKPGGVFVLRNGKPARVRVMTGISDGTFTEVQSDSLKEGDMVITGLDNTAANANNLTPPPGMGGPNFRGPGGGGGRR